MTSAQKVKLQGIRQINIKSEYIKLDALLKYASVASTGGEAKIMIQNGDVYVGGEQCFMRGKKIRPEDIVRINNNEVLIIKSKRFAKPK